MPNWCATNYAAKGDIKELQEFRDTLNTMQTTHENGFGRFWMGTFVTVLGKDWEKTGCRGTFDPDPYAGAYMCGPEPDESRDFEIGEDGVFRFSTVSAWDRCRDVEDIIREKWPSISLAFRSTDEFGNFHNICDPDGLLSWERYCLQCCEDESFTKEQFPEFLAALREATPGLDIPEDADEALLNSREFLDRFCKWREEDEDNAFVGFYIWEDVCE